MAVYFKSHNTSFNSTAIAAVAGKRIRVRRLIVTSAINTRITLQQDLGGPNQADIAPVLESRQGGSPIDLSFPDECPQTAVGESLGYVASAIGDYGIWIEYDLAV